MAPPRQIPPHLLDGYTLGGRIAEVDSYFDESMSDERVFRHIDIMALIQRARLREPLYYGETDIQLFRALDGCSLSGRTVVVVGSQTPWYEAIALSRGARECYTIDYQTIRSEHPAVRTFTPAAFANERILADVGLSVSSVEHSGLGRYGDELDPNGDLKAMRSLKAMVRPGGLLFLSVPVGADKLVWNAHRIYGKLRLPLLLAGWTVVAAYGFSAELLDIDCPPEEFYQPVFVLENTAPDPINASGNERAQRAHTGLRFLLIQESGRIPVNMHFRECHSLSSTLERFGHSAEVWGLGHPGFDALPNLNGYDVILNLENYDEVGWLPDLSPSRAFKMLWAIDEHCKGTGYYEHLANRDKVQLVLHSTRDYATDGGLWFPNCYDPALIGPRPVPKTTDVGFCGHVLNRAGVLGLLAKRFAFIHDHGQYGEAMVCAVNSYRVGFNANIANDVNYRSFETIACGVPLVTNYNAQYPSLGFEDGVNCILYRTDAELIDKIQWLLDNPQTAEAIGSAGMRLARAHTYDKRVGFLLETLSRRL